MYLKSIEMQGFKSFADRTILKFPEGITGIVGPNGSGKSNIGDAMRWVLGEQSAKQLRGGAMADVIFAGTESRKPLGFASVTITLDNADKALPVEYETVSVCRRLYRSGESEYLMNGHSCRLRDIQELFYDTGVGKEGYSIIGQGQIDHIVSGKPEERRELLDEAAGIVKFKRRKAAALKKLDAERENLSRVTDILSELTRQIGPLEKQSEKAKIYLQKRDELKENEISLFCLDEERITKEEEQANEKLEIARDELSAVKKELDFTKEEYERIEGEINERSDRTVTLREGISSAALLKEQLGGQIELLKEQIKNTEQAREIYEGQLSSLAADRSRRKEQRASFRQELEEIKAELSRVNGEMAEAEAEHAAFADEIARNAAASEEKNQAFLSLLSKRNDLQSEKRHFQTLDEQLDIQDASLVERLSRLSQRLDNAKSEDESCTEAYKAALTETDEKKTALSDKEKELEKIKVRLENAARESTAATEQYHRDKAMLESLTGIAERYEGYGVPVRRIMELKNRNEGIAGVVAELIFTEDKYETAIETALGGSLQNVVTDNEATAKYLIEYLKRGRYGRATFLPLSVMKSANAKEKPIKEKGFIGIASDLVDCEDIYRPLAERLLGRTFIIDTIDNAIAIGRKYAHKYRMVTLEGELISAGGSMTGGAYKNNANLLGRKRQIEELGDKVKKGKERIAALEQEIARIKDKRSGIRDAITELSEVISELAIRENTLRVQFELAKKQFLELSDEENDAKEKRKALAASKEGIAEKLVQISEDLVLLDADEARLKDDMSEASVFMEELYEKEKTAAARLEKLRMLLASFAQKEEFAGQNIENTDRELSALDAEEARMRDLMSGGGLEIENRRREIGKAEDGIASAVREAENLEKELAGENERLEALKASHNDFFENREALTNRAGLLDKECFRLENTLEKLEAEKETAVTHLFEEYGLTPLSLERPDLVSADRSGYAKNVKRLKEEIKALGSININAIDEYKEVSERHAFLSGQYEDIVKASDALTKVIADLDTGMRKQFSERFADIRSAFSKTFRELFNGGKAELLLEEGEELLDAGIMINVQPPGKKLQNMMQLSGGEKALSAIALLFAIQNLKPSPFCLLDEIEAALDEPNVARFAEYLHKLTGNTQFIVITHRRGTMTEADRLYGIAMQEKGVSAMVSVDLIEGQLDS